MNYTEVSLEFTNEDFTEILEAELAEIDFESFVNEGKTLKAYISAEQFSFEKLREILDQYHENIVMSNLREIAHQNWNSVWESNYAPVTLDSELFIGASFHEISVKTKYSMVLEPNMSFGTGHHPTTEMVLRSMFNIDLENKSVLDFGCGSAILSIYAAYKNAHGIGIEVDPYAADAARQNLTLNKVSSFKIVTGGIETLESEKYDVILANINKNVIEECLPTFQKIAKTGTKLLCSGFLSHDVDDLTSFLRNAGFEINEVKQIEDWSMIETTFNL